MLIRTQEPPRVRASAELLAGAAHIPVKKCSQLCHSGMFLRL